MYRLLTMLMLGLATNLAWPQDDEWIPFGPERKHIYCLVIDWNDPNFIYAGGSDGQNAVLYRSIDRGKNWSSYIFKNPLWLTGGLSCLAIDPHNHQVLYSGNVFGIYKSTDQGLTWGWVTSKLPGYLGASAIAIDPSNSTNVYFCINGQGVYKSMDAGASWALTGNADNRPLWAQTIVIDPETSSTIYAGTSGNGVFKTANGGKSWMPINTGFPPTERDVRALAIDRKNPLTIYAGQYTGPFMTTDGGAHWEKLSFTTTPVFSLAIDPKNPEIIYAGTLGEGVFKSTDRGRTWRARNRLLPTLAVDKLVLDPNDPTNLYALTYSGIYRLRQSVASTNQENTVLRFIAIGGDREAEISWETSHENNLAGFVLLRSVGAATGTFTEIANFNRDSALVAKGTTGRFSRRYIWSDLAVANDTIYWYKLKIVTKTGEETIAAPIFAAPSAGNILVQSDETRAWEWQNPLPTGNGLWDVDFVDANHGWIAGEQGTMLRTTDGGRSWKFLNAGVEVKNGGWLTEVNFRQIKFFDPMNGVIGGYTILGTDDGAGEQLVLRTTDGGETWKITLRLRNLSPNRWLDMFFLDTQQGWLFIDGQGIFRTLDGGFSWTKIGTVPPPFTYGGVRFTPTGLYKLFFITPDSGFGAIGDQHVFQTIDGGKNWVAKLVLGLGFTNDIFFIDKQMGWMVDDGGHVFQTTDAGRSWNLQQTLGSFNLFRIRFIDKSTGFILAYQSNLPAQGPDQGIIFKTTDGGATWTRRQAAPDILLAGFDAIDNKNLWIAGLNIFETQRNFAGAVLRSENQGETWKPLHGGILATIIDLQFADLELGWALGSREDSLRQRHAVLFNTTNGGKRWQMQTMFPTHDPRRLLMLDAQHGWIFTSGFNGVLQNFEWTLYRTTDGWKSWQGITFTGNQLNDARFFDALHGWAGGMRGTLLWTEDGGKSWQLGRLATADSAVIDVERLYFIDNRQGWAAGWNGRQFPYYGVLLETQDGGHTWWPIWMEKERRISDLVFVDARRGWATVNQNLILHTRDGGRNWQAQDPDVPSQFLPRIIFADSLLGWALSNYGQVIYTTDGGRLWQKQQRLTDGLTTMTFIDPAHGWIAGSQGKILATVQGGLPFGLRTTVSQPKPPEFVASYRLYQNYPNPFNPSTRIVYDLAANNRVSLKIFNMLGQEVKTLLDNKFEAAGRHVVLWDGRDNAGNSLATSLYFYRLQTGEFAETRKLLLMK